MPAIWGNFYFIFTCLFYKCRIKFLTGKHFLNFISIYHMGLYADPTLLKWFEQEYRSRVKGKLDMGKSCIRFKKAENIPFELIGELCTKMTVQDWISLYEKNYKS